MLKKLTTFWRFLLPILFVMLVAIAFLSHQQTHQSIEDIHQQAENKALSLTYLFTTSYKLVGNHASSAMRLLKQKAEITSLPYTSGSTTIGQDIIPNLHLNHLPQTNQYNLVDDISSLMEVKTSIFVKQDNDFVRIATNILMPDGSRATGTKLDRSSQAYRALANKQSFKGVVNIFGTPYITEYVPMIDAQGQLIGAYFVGNEVNMQVLRESIEKTYFLKDGFIAVLDNNKHTLLFHSNNKTKAIVEKIIANTDKNWRFVTKVIPEWQFKIVVAYSTLEAETQSFYATLPIFSAAVLLSFCILLFLLWQYRRLILNPIGSDPKVAVEVIQGIAQGKLSADHLVAKPDTLMHHVLNMRDELRVLVGKIQTNADRLGLSASVFEHTHDGIFILGTNHKILDINPAFTTISGYTREQAIGQTPKHLKFAFENPSFFDGLWNNKVSLKDWRGEIKNLHADGTVYDASLDLFPVENQQQEITHFVGIFADISSTKKYRANLEHMAYHDNLTGLPNRPFFSERLEKAMESAQQANELLAVCYFDLDDFKIVNDTLGHEAGDQLLVELAQRMRACMRETDTIARMGGDEFAMLLCGLHSIEECELTLDRLLTRIKAPFDLFGNAAKVSASIGYTIAPYDDGEADTLIRHADHAMYQIKVNGGSGYHLFDTEFERIKRHQRQTRDEISNALANHEFVLYFQPKVDMRRGKMFGIEALIRWNHEVLGLRLPHEFLPQIEHTSLIITLGEWALHETLKQLSIWLESGLEVSASVNIAPRHLLNPDFSLRLKQILEAFPQVKPSNLMLEITESAAIDDIAAVTNMMIACKNYGVKFALDDFGVGYSSLTYMRRLPVDLVKIDQSFVRDMLDDPDDLALVAGIISLSREFGHQVIAEGVESTEHGTRLLSMGCKFAQGYGIAHPMPADELIAWSQSFVPDPKWTV